MIRENKTISLSFFLSVTSEYLANFFFSRFFFCWVPLLDPARERDLKKKGRKIHLSPPGVTDWAESFQQIGTLCGAWTLTS
jgi:hypothetical protein